MIQKDLFFIWVVLNNLYTHTCIHIAVAFIDRIERIFCHVEMLSKNDITLIQIANEPLPFIIHQPCEPSWPNSNNF